MPPLILCFDNSRINGGFRLLSVLSSVFVDSLLILAPFVLCFSLFCCAVFSIFSCFPIISLGKRELLFFFTLTVFLMSCGYSGADM